MAPRITSPYHPEQGEVSLFRDSVSSNRQRICQSERLVKSWESGLEPWFCGRLVGWVKARAYLRTVLPETPSRRAVSPGRGLGSCHAAPLPGTLLAAGIKLCHFSFISPGSLQTEPKRSACSTV